MAAIYWQRGEAIDYTPEEAVSAGEVVSLTNRCGVAGCDIEAGKTGSLFVEGVFIVPTSVAFGQGDVVYYDTSSSEAAASGVLLGWCVEANTAEDGEVKVKLGA